MTDYGRDLWCDTDLSPTMKEVTGPELVAQAICHRLYCDQASMLSAPDAQTINLTNYLSRGIDAAQELKIRAAVTGAVLADERVLSASTVVEFNGATETLTVTVSGVGALGPFRLTLAVDAVSVRVLSQ